MTGRTSFRKEPLITLTSLSRFTRQLATYARSGVPLRQVFAGLEKSAPAGMRRAVSGIRQRLDEGERLVDAMRASYVQFPTLFLRMVEVGEQTGTLDEVLLRLADYYEWQLDLRRRFLASLAYPITLAIVAIFVVAVVSSVLASIKGEEQPYMHSVFVFLAGVAILFGILLVWKIAKAIPLGKCASDYLSVNLPVIGPILRQIHLSRLTLAMALQSRAAIGVPEMLEQSAQVTDNQAYIDKFRRAADRVRQGGTLTDALLTVDLLPIHFVQGMAVAEESGHVDETLDRFAGQASEEARRGMTALSKVVSGLVYAGVMVFVIYMIFSIFYGTYYKYLSEGVPEVGISGGR